jgi:predicted GNAT family acetyltransferase
MGRFTSPMPAPTGPIIPVGAVVPGRSQHSRVDVIAAVRDSGTVIAFIANGLSRDALTTRAYHVMTSADGCGLGIASDLNAFAAQYCDRDATKRELLHLLALRRPTADPTAQMTRSAVSGWIRTLGLLTTSLDGADDTTTGLPDWHLHGDV